MVDRTPPVESSVAPAVRSILHSARTRSGDTDRVSVDARSFPDRLAALGDDRRPVIAEIKPTSPTTDGIRADDPVALAQSMIAGGAAAISVLTEPDHFGGSIETLTRVRNAVSVPVLRKDFILRESQLDAVAADLVLLIARFCNDLPAMVAAARERGFQVLVEVHSREELRSAIEAGASIIGINNRDLASLTVDLGTFERLAPAVPDDRLVVAESGMSTPADCRRMVAAGADALLIGTAIMDGDVTTTTRDLTTPAQ
ncbi:indole-3-glycerol phosphate synthase [Halocatena halophila]|uniref:indole-3-glycerol phosphate synthase n=1 Tax=Halocatena halophila TaxID=2814576 RepID=UPI0038B3FDDB